MVLPIVAYNANILRVKCVDIDKNYPNIKNLIKNMFDTMYASNGVGLAAPQIGKNIKLFVVDGSGFADEPDFSIEERAFLKTFKKVFINATIVQESGEEWIFNEGCLSIPGINEDVKRKPNIIIEYLDEDFNPKRESFSGLAARIIQHEYDHTLGILFIDKLSSFKKRLIQSKLNNISKGKINTSYRMIFEK